MSFFVPGNHITLSNPFKLLYTVTVFQTLLLMTLTFLTNPGQVSFRMSLTLNFSDVFLITRVVLEGGGSQR